MRVLKILTRCGSRVMQTALQVMARKGNCVVCVAEGAGQALAAEQAAHGEGTDASGNPILQDIGIFLRDKLKQAIQVRRPSKGINTALVYAAVRGPLLEGIGMYR